jgi:hypothetical protein
MSFSARSRTSSLSLDVLHGALLTAPGMLAAHEKKGGIRMESARSLLGSAPLAALVLAGSVIAACDGGPSGPPPRQVPAAATPAGTIPAATIPASPIAIPATRGTGTLTVAVADPDGRALAHARVSVFAPRQTALVGSVFTAANGVATVDSVPATALVHVHHAFGEFYRNENVDVGQEGVTFLGVTLRPKRPQPTVALLPVTIRPGSLDADRSELTLEITIVASASAPFVPAGYGDYSAVSTPALGLALGPQSHTDSQRQCSVWLDRARTAPSCVAWGESPYTVSVEQFDYDRVGTVPIPASQRSAKSAMLVIDQSQRVSTLDASGSRSFAARRFIERIVTSSEAASLSVAGLAGKDGDAGPASLPELPLWTPLGPGFSTDRAVLEAGVRMLEPLVGGAAPVFDALEAAVTLMTAGAPLGDRAMVALLGGGDDGEMSDAERAEALASLRLQREDADIRSILIAAVPPMLIDPASRFEHRALAELAAALRAPTIALGVTLSTHDFYAQTWESGVYAALDLAADLIAELPLPALSAAFRVKASGPGAFPAGATLQGSVYVESDICPMGCWEIPLAFAVEIP